MVSQEAIMKALFTVQPSTGHLHPLVPLANALSAAGHEVAVCSARSFRSEVEAFGLRHFDAGLDWLTSDHSTWNRFPPMPPPGPEFAEFVVKIFADITTGQMATDLLRVAREFGPDIIVRESMEYGGCIAAEVLGIPHASVAGNAYSAVDSPRIHYFPGNRRMVGEPLGRHRKSFGLSPDPEIRMPFRYLHLCFTPQSWDGIDSPRPNNSRFLRHVNTMHPGETLPNWINDLPLPNRPIVLASLGTVFNKTPGILEAIIDAIGREDVNLIVAIGRDENPKRFGSLRSNVRLEAYVPQALLLPYCDVFITHGGFNSVKESLIAGVPMVVVPITADQPYSAERCAALGVGQAVPSGKRNATAIRDAFLDVLGDDAYRTRARAFQCEMESLPDIRHAVGLMEEIAEAVPTSR
jgi:UDP:flavonoid glycosyltransferase YjiC (YdhE family)